ncbi:unnamed protein product [Symbiodinium necroappetens]|uniref:Uncharacterized protein n=1 Tax=Symbiodinium necroappetens TaxID=1628268 RepID=A0A812VF31_9DINO|nr:unnamed protein product [Symbiodinium necroappetens]
MMTASKWTWSDTTPTASGITISGELRPRASKPYSLRLLNQFFIGVCDNPAQAKPAEPEAVTTVDSLWVRLGGWKCRLS